MLKPNTRLIILLGLLLFSLFISNCKKDNDQGMNPPSLDSVTNLLVTDIADEGNGLDLQIAFSNLTDETNVGSYRVFVVNSTVSGSFDLAEAETITASNYTSVDKTGANISIALSANSRTTSGELIANGNPYKVFVMSVSDHQDEYLSALSASSAEIILMGSGGNPMVKVTYIANDGVMIEFEDQKVIIDGMNRASNLSGWISPSNVAYQAVENGDPPFDDIDVIMITHNHGDHYSVSAVTNYLTNHPNTKLIVPASIEPNFAAFSSQIPNFNVNKFERINLIENEVSIDVLHVEHFDQFGNDFSMVESFAYIVTMNGKKFLHTGDIDYVDSQLNLFNLLVDDITVAFIPTFGDLVNTANRDALINNVDPDNVVCLHFLSSSLTSTLTQVNAIYPGAETFTIPFETLEY